MKNLKKEKNVLVQGLLDDVPKNELIKKLLNVGYSPASGGYYGINTSKDACKKVVM